MSDSTARLIAAASDGSASSAATSASGTASALDASAAQTSATLSAGETAGTASAVAATPSAAAEAKAKPTDTLRGLSAQDLRELADLEEARSLGQITVKQYEARRNEILQKTN